MGIYFQIRCFPIGYNLFYNNVNTSFTLYSIWWSFFRRDGRYFSSCFHRRDVFINHRSLFGWCFRDDRQLINADITASFYSSPCSIILSLRVLSGMWLGTPPNCQLNTGKFILEIQLPDILILLVVRIYPRIVFLILNSNGFHFTKELRYDLVDFYLS